MASTKQQMMERGSAWAGKSLGQGPNAAKSGMVQGTNNTSPGPTHHKINAVGRKTAPSSGTRNDLCPGNRLVK